MGIRLSRSPALGARFHQELVDSLRELLKTSRFSNLDDLGVGMQPPRLRTRRQLSELTTGARLPDVHELQAIVQACDPSAWPKMRDLLYAARGEATSRPATPPASMGDHAVLGPAASWPIVGTYSDWETLGVHKPITLLRTGEDLSDRLATTGLPTYVLRETDLVPGGLRDTLAAAAAGVGTRLVVVTGESLAGKTRAAAEAMRAVLPTWRLLLTFGADDLKSFLDSHPDLRHVVVWCDEIQDLLR